MMFVLVSYLVISCNNTSSSVTTNTDSTTGKAANTGTEANQLYEEGMKILNDRLSIQHSDKEKALELNIKAIEKFSAAYQADTMFTKPVQFASECTMYAKDYQNCIYWTSKWMQLDTTQENRVFCIGRINYCNEQLKSEQ